MVNTFSDRRGEILFFKDHKEYLNPCKHIIDIGCGTGNMADYFPQKYTGITTNPEEVKAGISRGRDIVLCDAHGEKLKEIAKGCDGFIMWDSLEHFTAPYLALKNIFDILPEDGRGLIFMPGQNWLDCRDHIHTMTVPQMMHILNKVNFTSVVHEKKYPDLHIACEGMAVYEVTKISSRVQNYTYWG